MAPRRARPPKTVDEYMARVPPKFRATLQRLRRLIKAAAPDAEEVISYQMPAFRQNGMLVYSAAFEDHCSLFVASDEVRRRFAAELKPFATGKGTLRFTPEQPPPARLVTRIVQVRVAENAARRSPGTVRHDSSSGSSRRRSSSSRRGGAGTAGRRHASRTKTASDGMPSERTKSM